MLINEQKLNMMNVEHRKLLEQEMIQFLFEGKDVHIEGYTPPEKSKSPLTLKHNKHNAHSRNDEKIFSASAHCAFARFVFQLK